jgi:hypothetical protein
MRILTATLLILLCSAARATDDNPVRVVDFPGAAATFIFALNNAGQFVGAEQDGAAVPHAIFDDGRRLRLLDLSEVSSGGAASYALSINNHSDIAGAYADASGVFHGYVHHADGTLTHIDFPGASSTWAYGVNDRGTVIGIYVDAQTNVHAFVRRDGGYRNADLPGAPATSTTPLSVNDQEQIVGEYITTSGTNGFGYLQSRNGDFALTTAPDSVPQGTFFISINNREQILGAYADAGSVQHNFLLSGGVYHEFDLPARLGATFVSAQTVNDADGIVGYFTDSSQLTHGFVAAAADH